MAALLDRLPPRTFIAAHAFTLAAGERIDLPRLRKRLADAGYAQVTQVLSPGEFAVRGSVVDLYPAGAPQPYRLDLFDDLIESVRQFDPSDQRSGGTASRRAAPPGARDPLVRRGHRRLSAAAGANDSKAIRSSRRSTAR